MTGRLLVLSLWLAALVGSGAGEAHARECSASWGGVYWPRGAIESAESDDPVSAAILLSRQRYPEPDTASWAVVSRDDNWPDALAATSLVGAGPLLFTGTDRMRSDVQEELDRVLPAGAPVYLLGGPAAISTAVEQRLVSSGYEVRRLAGEDRIDTAIAIAEETVYRYSGQDESCAGFELFGIDGWSPRIVIARAYGTPGNPTAGWADSVAVGPAAARFGMPVLVTGSDRLDPRVADALERLAPVAAHLVGGSAALSADVETQVRAVVADTSRVSGSDRAATAVEIADDLGGHLGPVDPHMPVQGPFVLVDGHDPRGWAFGLAAATRARVSSTGYARSVLFVRDGVAPPPTLATLRDCGSSPASVLLAGPSSSFPASLFRQIQDARPSRCVDEPWLFLNVVDDTTPASWRTCEPIRIVHAVANAPSAARDAVARAVEYVQSLGHWRFELVTVTESRPAEAGEIVVSWPDPYWGGGSTGQAGTYGFDDAGHYWSSDIILNRDRLTTAAGIRATFLHELGHSLGLDHVQDRSQVMNHVSYGDGHQQYQHGDLAALRLLAGHGAC